MAARRISESAGTVIDPVATAIHLLDGYRTENRAVQRWYASLLKHLCRELEDFAPRNVSEAARDKAKAVLKPEFHDLRRFHWDDQPKFDKRKGGIFHWEHLVPVNDLFCELVELRKPNSQSVGAVLRKASIAWILKTEDAELTKRGERHGRADPWKSYENAKINLIFRECGRCERKGGSYECREHKGWEPWEPPV